MSGSKPLLPLWPFVVADALFLALAAALLRFGHRPLSSLESFLMVLCGGLGSISFLAPFLRRNADAQAYSQVELLSETMGQFQKLDQLAGQISAATNLWTEMQTHAIQATKTAQEVADKMATEAEAVNRLMQRTTDGERTQLRIEVEKLRRSEGERLQVLVHILDHVFALLQAARRSGQPALLDQVGQFQNACCETARRVGLVQIGTQAGHRYNSKVHQLPDNATAPENAMIEDTVAPGYSYQGQILRRALVALKSNAG